MSGLWNPPPDRNPESCHWATASDLRAGDNTFYSLMWKHIVSAQLMKTGFDLQKEGSCEWAKTGLSRWAFGSRHPDPSWSGKGHVGILWPKSAKLIAARAEMGITSPVPQRCKILTRLDKIRDWTLCGFNCSGWGFLTGRTSLPRWPQASVRRRTMLLLQSSGNADSARQSLVAR